MKPKWTPDQIDEIKQAWALGYPASKIGESFGVTRNAIIGVLHRNTPPGFRRLHGKLGASSHSPATRRMKQIKRPRVVAELSVKAKRRKEQQHLLTLARQMTHEPDVPSVHTVDDLTDRHCRWPIGDPQEAGFGYCGADTYRHYPYCSRHAVRAFVPDNPGPPRPFATLYNFPFASRVAHGSQSSKMALADEPAGVPDRVAGG